MLAGSQKKTNGGIIGGVLLVIAGQSIANPPDMGSPILGALTTVAGLILFAWGCCAYMRGKGYHAAFGLIGLLWLPGLVVLFLFRDRYKCCAKGDKDCTHGRIDTRRDRSARAA